MDIRFTAMDHDTCSSSANGTTTSSSGIQGFLPPWSCSPPALSLAAMRPCQALTSAGAWGYALVGQCFSRVYRVQFDEEHQRSLLSCHSTEGEDGSYAFPDEAMLELRRRVLKVDADSHHVRKPTFAKDLDLAYPVQTPVYLPQNRNPTSRWEKRKANALAFKLQAASNSQQQATSCANNNKSATTISTTSTTTTPMQLKSLLSDTEKALDDILGTYPSNQQQQQKPQADDVRRLSVDELLALRPASSSSLSTCSTSSVGSLSPDKPLVDSDEDEEQVDNNNNNLSPDAKLLRQWLADVDPPRTTEYHAYARCFEAQGFQALEDLAELDEHEVEQAMSEVGISKFAHRVRLRKAILRLRSESFQNEHSSILMTSD